MKIPKWLSSFAKAVECAIEKHKAVSRLTLLWIVLLISWATWRVFSDLAAITPAAAAAYGTLCGLLGGVIALYQWRATK